MVFNTSANCNCRGWRTMARSVIVKAVFAMHAMVKEWILQAIIAQILLVLCTYEGLAGLFHIGRLL